MALTTRAAVPVGVPDGLEHRGRRARRAPRQRRAGVGCKAAGMCHSDDHAHTGDLPLPLPLIGGHEGAGVVEAVGPDVRDARRRRPRGRVVRPRLRALPEVLDGPPVPLRQRAPSCSTSG